MASRIIWLLLLGAFIHFMPISRADTNAEDVYAINSFYTALGSPPLPGWIADGGDPCSENWQGVECVGPNITGIVINAANLGGQLGDQLGNFTTIITIDLSNNNIGGAIPENLPLTLQKFFLSANQFTGRIPDSLSKLSLLTDMSLNQNQLSGNLPDAFQALTGLINLDLSSNNLSGQLPPSTGNLSSLTTFHVQNNQLSGSLNVLEGLPLKDLNIENNLFSGPIPEKLLTIPKFKKDGNPFNTSVAPSSAPPGLAPSPAPALPPSAPPGPPPSAPPGSPPSAPRRSPSHSPPSDAPPDTVHSNSSIGPSARGNTDADKKRSKSTMKVVGYVIASVVLFIVMVLLMICCVSKYHERKIRHEELLKNQVGRPSQGITEFKFREQLTKPKKEVKKVSKGSAESHYEYGSNITMAVPQEVSEKENEHIIDVGATGVTLMPPLPAENVIVAPTLPVRSIASLPSERLSPPLLPLPPLPPPPPPPPTSVAPFSVSLLQQYTNSFDEENLIRESRLGKVYLAEHPNGTIPLLEVMNIDNVNSQITVDDFLDLVFVISEIRHPNIVELVGYCAEFEQRLLVYKFFSKRSLDDMLHGGDDSNRKLSWNARLSVALGAAKALEHLHENCQPPLVHKHFEPANLLVDNEFNVRVSECGLSLLKSSSSVTQLSGRLRSMFTYEAPELNESGTYTDKSDVYSFGVVMLELLTGRKPYDSSRPRAEQHLVRWARSQLYDIDALSRMVDPSIAGKCPERSLSRFADIINTCIQQEPEFRRPMSAIVQDLTSLLADTRRTRKGNSA